MRSRAIPILPGYEILERIGRGAGAVISLARETASGRLVAIKHVVRRTADDDRFIVQAENEFQVARQVEHRYLRRCYEIVRVRKWLKTRELFLIMEYVDGVRLEDHRPAEMGPVVSIFKKTAEGLHALHEQGYAHADIKPHNILLTRDGLLKIIDFGQSCPLGHVKQRVQGTPDYMAPEQIFRKAIDRQTDVFCLGATMYWVCTGKRFRTLMPTAPAGSKMIEIESERGSEPPHILNPATPIPLSNLIMECCAPVREQRPRDMREVVSWLEVVRHLLQRRRAGSRPAPPPAGSAG